MFKPEYKLTGRMLNDLTSIAEMGVVIARAKILPKQELRLRRQAIVRMSHSSTGIEGNQLNLYQVEALQGHKKVDAPKRDIYEVENYLKALRYIGKVVKDGRGLNHRIVLKIHSLLTHKTLPPDQSGHYRKIPVYVVRQVGGNRQRIMYTAPDARQVEGLMTNLLDWITLSGLDKINPVIAAAIVHQEIAAIHPFTDGNGRTARALATLVLYARGYDFRRLFALEDYYNDDRPAYYKAINIGRNYDERRKADMSTWLEYFITGFKQEIELVKQKVVSLSRHKVGNINSQIFLDKDQLKIIDFLENVGRITLSDAVDIFDCPRRTAQLYLQRLKKIKMIKQVGKGPVAGYVLEK